MKKNRLLPFIHAAAASPGTVAALLALMTLAVYARCSAFGFQSAWDDSYYLVNDVVQGEGFASLAAAFTQTFQGHYSPLVLLSYRFDFFLGGHAPAVFHAHNVLLHAVNTALVYLLLRRLTERPGLAATVALIFALHPVNVEAVAWIAQRKTLLSATFALLTLLSYLQWQKNRRPGFCLAAGIFFLCGLLCKASIVGLPLLLFFLESGSGNRPRSRRLLAPAAMLLLAGVVAVVTTLGFAHAKVASGYDLPLLFGTIYPSSLAILVDYLRLIVWPLQLSAFYDTALVSTFLAPKVLLALLLLGTGGWFLLRHGSRDMRFWALWAVSFYLPNSNLIPLQTYYADRYLYLPLIGIVVCAVLLAERLIGSDAVRATGRWLPAGVAVVVMLLATLAWQRCEVWRDELALWSDTAAKSPQVYKVRLNYAVALEKARRYDEAIREYTVAVALYPDPVQVSHLKMLNAMRHLPAPVQPPVSR